MSCWLSAKWPDRTYYLRVELPEHFWEMMAEKYGIIEIQTDAVDQKIIITRDDIKTAIKMATEAPEEYSKESLEGLDKIEHDGYYNVLNLWKYSGEVWVQGDSKQYGTLFRKQSLPDSQ